MVAGAASKGAGHVTKVRQTVTTARSDATATKADATDENSAEATAMRNLAYVVSSANDNIQALQRTVKLQEKELNEKTDQCAALQRNYETLARIRQADQNEFMQLKARQAAEQGEIAKLQSELQAARAQNLSLEQKLTDTEAARAQIVELQKQLEDVTASRDGFKTELEQVSGGRGSGRRAEGQGTNTRDSSRTRAPHSLPRDPPAPPVLPAVSTIPVLFTARRCRRPTAR